MGNLVYMFSSVRHRVYKQNLLDILAYPNGYILQFRYGEDIVDKRILKNPSELSGSRFLQVFVDQKKTNNGTKINGLYPLRYGRIVEMELVEGTILRVYFAVESFYAHVHHFDAKTSVDTYSIGKTYLENIRANLNSENLDSTLIPPSKYLVLGKDLAISVEAESSQQNVQKASSWIRNVRILANHHEFRRSVFFRILGVRATNGNNEDAVSEESLPYVAANTLRIKELLYRRSGYKLTSGQNYILEIVFYKPSHFAEIAGMHLNINANTSYFAFQHRRIRVDYHYDKLEIDLPVKHLTQQILTRFSMTLADGEELSATGKVRDAPQPAFLFAISPSDRLMVGFLVFLVGSLLTSFASQLESPYKEIAAALGPVFSTAVLLWLYGRLK